MRKRQGSWRRLDALVKCQSRARRLRPLAVLLSGFTVFAADVIDVDTLASGEQRSGLYFAAWGMTIKLSLALGVLLGTMLPAAFGYDPAATVTTPDVQARLMTIYGLVPALMMAAGALFLYRFPITRERHDEVRAALEARLGELK